MPLKFEILGTRCTTVEQLYQDIQELILQEQIDATVRFDDSFLRMSALGIRTSPGLLINEILVSSGKTYTKPELRTLVHQYTSSHQALLAEGSRCSGQGHCSAKDSL